jgi:electron transport complex protein RnfC
MVGLGGAMFPTQVKLSPPPEKKIDTIILNGAECEPYLTADHRLMLENPEEIVSGLKIILRATGAPLGYIGIEDNKPDAVRVMKETLKDEKNIQVIPVKTKYPQGGEKQLIKSILNREVPSGGLPMDVGVIVQNVGTAYAIAQAFLTGLPLVERVVTIAGKGIREPANLRVKIGTLISGLIEECGGFTGEVEKVIVGGPLMGMAQYTLDVPVIKGTTGVLIQIKEEVEKIEPSVCIKCAKCVDVCPMFLLPNFLADYAEHGKFEEACQIGLLDCIECGACAYVCASKRDLIQLIKLAKSECQKKG